MAEVQWYYARNDQPMGPVSATELQQLVEAGELKPDDLLWREGMEAWTTAINLRGLFEADRGQQPGGLSPIVRPRAENRPLLLRSERPSVQSRLQSLVEATQIILWTTCVLVVLVGVVLFTRAFLTAETPAEEAAAGAVYAAFFVAAYVLARCGEKVSQLLLARTRRRGK
jgi:hypothetical protein